MLWRSRTGSRGCRVRPRRPNWWADVGPIDLNDVAVQYTGLYCWAETDWDSPTKTSDQPYVTLGVVAPGASLDTTRSQIYQDVDSGDSRPDLIELYRGKPYGIAIPMVLAEWWRPRPGS